MDNNKLEILFEFFAKYVRKIYGDRYLKSVIKNQAGISLLDIITPSDISYVICLIKNSKVVWSQADDDADLSTKVRPLFTSGEGKKRTLGDTTWNKTGLGFFKGGVDTWKLAFQGQMQACEFNDKFEAWMETTGKAIRLNRKTRMNLYSVLGTTREEDMSSAVARQGSNGDEDDESEAEINVDYDTDTSGDQPFGGEWGNKKPAATRNTSVNEKGGNEDEEPDANVEQTTVVMSPPVVSTRGGEAARDRTTRLASPPQGGGNVEVDESKSHRLRDRSTLTPPRKGDDESTVQGRNRQKRNNAQVAEGGGRKTRGKK